MPWNPRTPQRPRRALELPRFARLRGLLRQRQFAEALAAGAGAARARRPSSATRCCSSPLPSGTWAASPRRCSTLATLRAAPSALQPPVRGARPLLRRAATGAAGDRGLPGGGEHQPRAAGQLEHARGPLPDDRAGGERGDGRGSQVATLQGLPPEVVTATGLFSDGDLDAGRADGPRLPAAARRPRRSDAAAGADRHCAQGVRRRRAAARGGARAGARLPGRARRLRRGADRTAQATRRRAGSSSGCCSEDPDNRLHYQGLHATAARGPRASTSAPSRSTASCCRRRRRMPTCTCRSRMR